MSGEGEQRSACLSGEEDKYVLVRVKRGTKKCLFEWRAGQRNACMSGERDKEMLA